MDGSLLFLSDKELTLLSHLQSTSQVLSQKILSEKTGISAGLINAVLKKMIQKGYVKVKAINKKKFHYLLSRKGSSQLIRKSYYSILNTIRHYQELESRIQKALMEISEETGKKKFIISENGELASIVQRVVRRHLSRNIQIMEESGADDCVILNLTDGNARKAPGSINLLHYLK